MLVHLVVAWSRCATGRRSMNIIGRRRLRQCISVVWFAALCRQWPIASASPDTRHQSNRNNGTSRAVGHLLAHLIADLRPSATDARDPEQAKSKRRWLSTADNCYEVYAQCLMDPSASRRRTGVIGGICPIFIVSLQTAPRRSSPRSRSNGAMFTSSARNTTVRSRRACAAGWPRRRRSSTIDARGTALAARCTRRRPCCECIELSTC